MSDLEKEWKGREGWRERLAAALAAGGCTSQTEWIAKYPGKHCWFTFDLARSWESCTNCGIVRRNDDKNKPCKGIVTVEPR